jgi:hypothetical protein
MVFFFCFFFVLCCQFLWIVPFWLLLRYSSLTFHNRFKTISSCVLELFCLICHHRKCLHFRNNWVPLVFSCLCFTQSLVLCVLFLFVLCCQFLWIVHFSLSLRYSLAFIYRWDHSSSRPHGHKTFEYAFRTRIPKLIRIRQQYNLKGKTRQHFTKTWINIGKRQNHCVLSQSNVTNILTYLLLVM